MVMRNKTMFTAMLVVALAAAACSASEPETVTSAASADESPPTTAQADAPDGLPDGDGEVSDFGESGESGSDDSNDSDESGSLGDEDSGESGASGSDDSDESDGAGYSGEDSGESSSSSSDDDASYSGEGSAGSSSGSDGAGYSGEDSGSSSGGAGEGSEPGSPDDTVSITPDDIVGDGADISDPGPSNSGEPAPPQDQRELAYIDNVAFQVLESWPMQVIVEVSGELPNPCHELWWEVDVDGNTYDVQVWQVSPPADTACAAVIEPFTENVPLGGGFVDDDYTVIVNGEPHSLNF